jgi:creatinine amidohydrolase/Fe(II)-dependent formamide hydrolase-like protein
MPTSPRDAFLAPLHANARHSEGPRTIDQAELDELDWTAGLRRDVVIVSMGNSAEGHSSALAADIDDRIGFHVATQVANHTGARYLGHCPFATDRLGGLAQQWSPACLSVDEFVAKTTAYVQFLLAAVKPAKQVWLLSGHGGNGAIGPYLPGLAATLGVEAVHYALALIAPPQRPDLNAQHAGNMEHGVARSLGPGCFQPSALAAWNECLAADFEAAVKAEPAAAGMAGYYIYGDARFDAIRNRYAGIKPAIAQVATERCVIANADDGALALAHTVATISAQIVEAHLSAAASL